MVVPSVRPRRPLPPGLRMTPAKKAGDKKDEAKPSGFVDGGRDSLTADTSQENRRTSLRFAAGMNPPQRHVPPRHRMEGIFGPNEKEDHSNTGESGEEGNENSTSGKCQETKWPRSTGGLSPCPRLRPLSPTTKTASDREAKNESKASGPGEEGSDSSTSDRGQENIHPLVPTTPRIGRGVLANRGGSANRSRTPSPQRESTRAKGKDFG